MRAQQALRTGTGLLLLMSFFSMPGCTSSALTRLTASCPASSARSQCAQASSQGFQQVLRLRSHHGHWQLALCSQSITDGLCGLYLSVQMPQLGAGHPVDCAWL